MEPHQTHKYKRIPWLVCRKCGLVFLNNEPTKIAIKLGCNWSEIIK